VTVFAQGAAGLLWDGDRIVVVCEQRAQGMVWSVPGGGVQPGELLAEAVRREVWEETGLTVDEVGDLALIVNTSTVRYPSAVVFFFECTWHGQLRPRDGDITDIACVDIGEAIDRIRSSPAPRRETEPLLAYLTQRQPVGLHGWRDDTPIDPNQHTGSQPRSGRPW